MLAPEFGTIEFATADLLPKKDFRQRQLATKFAGACDG